MRAVRTAPCVDPARCGRPQERGHPRQGWIKLHQAGTVVDPWFCSWPCLVAYAAHAAVRTGQADIA